MGVFENFYLRQDEKLKEAKLNYDREVSIGILLDLIKNIEALQNFAYREKQDMIVWMAEECCNNPIMSDDTEELPAVGLRVVQGMILDGIGKIDSAFSDDKVKGLYNIAVDGRCQEIVEICSQAISKLRAARV